MKKLPAARWTDRRNHDKQNGQMEETTRSKMDKNKKRQIQWREEWKSDSMTEKKRNRHRQIRKK